MKAALDAGPEHPFFPRALDYVTDHGYGKATQPIEANVTVNIADALKAARDRAAKR